MVELPARTRCTSAMNLRSSRFLLVLLAFCTFLAQGVSAVHAISHLPAGKQTTDQLTSGPQHSADCELCLAFATFGAAAPGAGPSLPSFAAISAAAEPYVSPKPGDLLGLYQARAPPSSSLELA